jgi:hypothetical protein
MPIATTNQQQEQHKQQQQKQQQQGLQVTLTLETMHTAAIGASDSSQGWQLTGGTSGSRVCNMRYPNLSFCFLSFAAQGDTGAVLTFKSTCCQSLCQPTHPALAH